MEIISTESATQILSAVQTAISNNILGIFLVVGTIFGISFVAAMLDQAAQGRLNEKNEGRGFNGRKLR